MDIATIIGFVLGLAAIILSITANGPLTAFWDPGSAFIVFGGTIAATFINYPLSEVLGIVGVLKNALLYKAPPPGETIKQLVHFAEMARREGILFLEKEMNNITDPFLKQGLQLAVDGTEPDLMRSILSTEIAYLQERHDTGAGIFDAMGAFAPAFGMIGTLIGLILMLGSMEDPSSIGPAMAVAMITTFYGAVLANLVFIPIAGKLKVRSSQEVLIRELMMEGILAMQSGDNPRLVEQKLISFIAPKLRATVKKEEG